MFTWSQKRSATTSGSSSGSCGSIPSPVGFDSSLPIYDSKDVTSENLQANTEKMSSPNASITTPQTFGVFNGMAAANLEEVQDQGGGVSIPIDRFIVQLLLFLLLNLVGSQGKGRN